MALNEDGTEVKHVTVFARDLDHPRMRQTDNPARLLYDTDLDVVASFLDMDVHVGPRECSPQKK